MGSQAVGGPSSGVQRGGGAHQEEFWAKKAAVLQVCHLLPTLASTLPSGRTVQCGGRRHSPRVFRSTGHPALNMGKLGAKLAETPGEGK